MAGKGRPDEDEFVDVLTTDEPQPSSSTGPSYNDGHVYGGRVYEPGGDLPRRKEPRQTEEHRLKKNRKDIEEEIIRGMTDEELQNMKEDLRVYCICREKYNEARNMIQCDRCDGWFHLDCCKLDEEAIDLIGYFACPECEDNDHQTLYLPRCSRPSCTHPCQHLSKYCSDWCGTEVAAMRLEKLQNGRGVNPMRFWGLVRGARNPVEGMVIREGSGVGGPKWKGKEKEPTTVGREEMTPDGVVKKEDDEAKMDLQKENDESIPPEPSYSESVLPPLPLSEKQNPSPPPPPQQQQPAPLHPHKTPTDHSDPDELRLSQLHSQLTTLVSRRSRFDSQLTIIHGRLKLLEVAIRRWESMYNKTIDGVKEASGLGQEEFERMEVEEEAEETNKKKSNNKKSSKKKKKGSKGKKKDTGNDWKSIARDEAPCAFDHRLVYDDREFESWLETEDGRKVLGLEHALTATSTTSAAGENEASAPSLPQEGMEGKESRPGQSSGEDDLDLTKDFICLHAKKKCTRHEGWREIREADFEVEKMGIIRHLDKLATQERGIRRKIEDHEEYVGFKAKLGVLSAEAGTKSGKKSTAKKTAAATR